jgi:hypothetical protein
MANQYHIIAKIPVMGGTIPLVVPDRDKPEPLITDYDTAQQTVQHLQRQAPKSDTFTTTYGDKPQYALYDMSRLGERSSNG